MNKVLIFGGLGNQMFQYALNIALNQKGNESRIIFSNFFYDNHHNGFNLGDAFQLSLPFPLNVYKFLLNTGFHKNKISSHFLRNYFNKHISTFQTYNEKKEFVFNEDVFQQKSKLIVGTWQAEEYFKDIKDILMQEFVFIEPTDRKNRKLVEEIKNSNSVSIHIRRGDYLNGRWIKSHAVIKDEKYYTRSINYMNENILSTHYYVFSDDILWAKENLKLPNCTFIDHNSGKNAYVDMYLMSLCQHNIIANSTFSWWAAWLNKNETKIVIMPERWLNNDNARGIFPSEWLKFKV